jgi:hypothetical protein
VQYSKHRHCTEVSGFAHGEGAPDGVYSGVSLASAGTRDQTVQPTGLWPCFVTSGLTDELHCATVLHIGQSVEDV